MKYFKQKGSWRQKTEIHHNDLEKFASFISFDHSHRILQKNKISYEIYLYINYSPHIVHNIKHTHVRLLSPLIVGTTPTHCTQQCIATELRTKRPTQMQYTSSTSKDSTDPSLQSRANNIFHKEKPMGCESLGVISCSAPFL